MTQNKNTPKIVDFKTKEAEIKDSTVHDLFGKNIILRNMTHLGSNEKTVASDAGFVRKYEQIYADSIQKYISRKFSISFQQTT